MDNPFLKDASEGASATISGRVPQRYSPKEKAIFKVRFVKKNKQKKKKNKKKKNKSILDKVNY